MEGQYIVLFIDYTKSYDVGVFSYRSYGPYNTTKACKMIINKLLMINNIDPSSGAYNFKILALEKV